MKYERLTAYSKINNDYITPYCDKFICDGCCRECDYEQVIINRLADFENKIENGTLVELPCKVGDTIYMVNCLMIRKWEVKSVEICEDNILFRLGHKGTDDYNSFLLGELGNYVFLTKDEAEKRLEEFRGEVAEEVIMTGPIIVGDVPEVEYQTEVAEWKPTEVRRSGKRNNRKS